MFLKKDHAETGTLSPKELMFAEIEVVKYVQRKSFATIIDALTKKIDNDRDVRRALKKITETRSLTQLCPILVNGLLRIGGRLDQAPIPFDAKHPKILPGNSSLTKLVIRHHHQKMGHSGVAQTWNSIREEYWIVKPRKTIKRELQGCIACKRFNARRNQQIMADLPPARLQADKPPFSHTGIDYFGPFLCQKGRSQVKKFGCLFTCMTTRCIHLELAEDLSTDAFINALRRFIARRREPDVFYSDNGTNLVGAYRVLKDAIDQLNQKSVEKFCVKRNITWKFNPPGASHMGGVWEILIRSVRRILNKIFYKSPVVSHDVLHTVLIECENIVNSRPLTPVCFEPGTETALTPNHLLKLKPTITCPPGIFTQESAYAKRRWEQVQYLANEFWRRWHKEYLPTIAARGRWPDKRRNLVPGDLVILVNENLPRNRWDMGRIVKSYPDKRGVVRHVDLKTYSGILKRPIHKLCLIREAEGEKSG